MGVDVLNRPAIFLDRDGVINCNVFNPSTNAWESPLVPEQLRLVAGVSSALRRLRQAGFLLFVVSNQPNAAKAKASLDTLHAIHDRLMLLLGNDKIFVDHFYYCFHHPEGIVPELSGACLCRKPSPLFLFQARDHFAIDLGNSWMVGDRSSDIECGRAAGVHTIRIENAEEQNPAISEEPRPEFIVDSLAAAAAIILSQGSAWK